ncbi:MAG: hypothetical protein AAF517_27615 [Planctomycetota bacterium]
MSFSPRTPVSLIACAMLAVLASCGGEGGASKSSPGEGAEPSGATPTLTVDAKVQNFCSACHLFPPPDTLPRALWGTKVDRMFELAATHTTTIAGAPTVDEAKRYFISRAPERLRSTDTTVHVGPGGLRVQKVPLRSPGELPDRHEEQAALATATVGS